MNYSVYAIAKSLLVEHDFAYDVAFLSAWYSRHTETPTATPAQVLVRIQNVKHYPKLTKQQAEQFLATYKKHLCG